MYNHQKGSSLDSEKINGIDDPKVETATFSTSKSVRISDETFYLGSTQSDSVSKGITSGKESPDSTYFSSIISDASEGVENGEILLCYVLTSTLLKYGFILTFFLWFSQIMWKVLYFLYYNDFREPAGFQHHHSMKTFPHPALKVTHPRTQSDSLFVSTGGTGLIRPSSPTLHKHRLASEGSAPIFKAAELHHNLLNLRLNLNSLYAERHKFQKELESTLLHRENLIAKQRVLKGSESSEPPNTQHLLELREKLAQESERTSHLLQLAVKAKQDVLNPESLDDISNLIKKYQDRKQEVVDQRIKSLEEQIEILKQNKSKNIFLYNLPVIIFIQ
ncbi:unnamed protein product [Hymenolepis diminuta]|uniref:Lebercilin domain-containing protein n=1 Tax=Hymenolepis diminuta TaxID=6216 RepID=A0A0R3SAP7_HYMDI|nr:unnamed protein product [Hymenolepis diminuta]